MEAIQVQTLLWVIGLFFAFAQGFNTGFKP